MVMTSRVKDEKENEERSFDWYINVEKIISFVWPTVLQNRTQEPPLSRKYAPRPPSAPARSRCMRTSTNVDPSSYRKSLDSSSQMFRQKVWRPITARDVWAEAAEEWAEGHCCRRWGHRPASCRSHTRNCGKNSDYTQTSEGKIATSSTSSFQEQQVDGPDQESEEHNRESVTVSDALSEVGDTESVHEAKEEDVLKDRATNDNVDDDDDEFGDLEKEEGAGKPGGAAPDLKLRSENIETYADDMLALDDPLKYEFDVHLSDIPIYEFSYPLPDVFENVSFRRLAHTGDDWRTRVKKIKNLSELDQSILDRVMDLEKSQLLTETFEGQRRDFLRKAIKDQQELTRRLRAKGVPQCRITANARVGSARRSHKCCNTCLQIACTGDCPNKVVRPRVCALCRQVYCVGSCVRTQYEDHERNGTVDGDKQSAAEARADADWGRPRRRSGLERPKSCTTCYTSRGSRSNARLFNGNLVALGRPPILRATFSSGVHSKRPTDCRRPADHLPPAGQSPAPMSFDMIEKFENIGISPVASSSTKLQQRPRSRGRDSVIPGKSFSSNRKESLTARPTKLTLKRRPKSAKI